MLGDTQELPSGAHALACVSMVLEQLSQEVGSLKISSVGQPLSLSLPATGFSGPFLSPPPTLALGGSPQSHGPAPVGLLRDGKEVPQA